MLEQDGVREKESPCKWGTWWHCSSGRVEIGTWICKLWVLRNTCSFFWRLQEAPEGWRLPTSMLSERKTDPRPHFSGPWINFPGLAILLSWWLMMTWMNALVPFPLFVTGCYIPSQWCNVKMTLPSQGKWQLVKPEENYVPEGEVATVGCAAHLTEEYVYLLHGCQ